MVAIKRSEMRQIDNVFDMQGGYVLDFSNRTFSEFFEDEFRINIYDEKYHVRGTSKANLLRGFIEVEDGYMVGKVLRKLYDYRCALAAPQGQRARALGRRTEIVLRAAGQDRGGRQSANAGLPLASRSGARLRHGLARYRARPCQCPYRSRRCCYSGLLNGRKRLPFHSDRAGA